MGSFWITYAVFLVTVILCHLLMFSFRRNPSFWKQVDYFWLGVGVLGLVGLTGESRKLIANNMTEVSESRFYSMLEHAQQWTSWAHDYYDRLASDNSEPTEENRNRILEYKLFSEKLKEVSRKLHAELLSNEWLELFTINQNPIQSQCSEIVNQEKRLQRIIADVDNAYKDLADNQKARKTSGVEEILIVLSPSLIAIALGIRITKVTAELKGFDKAG